jgi:hypothetical protein
MSSQPTGSSALAGSGYAASLPPWDWELLVLLPARMLAAMRSIRRDTGTPERRSGASREDKRPESDDTAPAEQRLAAIAAIAAIAAGRTSASVLLREVVAAIYANDDPPVEPVGHPITVRADCTAAARILAQRVPSAEAARYREWVVHVGVVGLSADDDPVGAAQLRLLHECERALAG